MPIVPHIEAIGHPNVNLPTQLAHLLAGIVCILKQLKQNGIDVVAEASYPFSKCRKNRVLQFRILGNAPLELSVQLHALPPISRLLLAVAVKAGLLLTVLKTSAILKCGLQPLVLATDLRQVHVKRLQDDRLRHTDIQLLHMLERLPVRFNVRAIKSIGVQDDRQRIQKQRIQLFWRERGKCCTIELTKHHD